VFGVTIVTCDKGDIRQTSDGVRIHGDTVSDVSLDGLMGGRDAEIEELYGAVTCGRPPLHDGRWGKASVEVCLAMLRSGSERKEIMLEHQVPVRD
jgi:phthalate 4,5-cis-dihydrodiol dehydrogenase